MSQPQNRTEIADIATSPEFRESTRAVSASITRGVIEGMQLQLAGTDLGEEASKLAAGVGEQSETILREHIAPGAAAVASKTVDASLATASSKLNLERTQQIVEATSSAAVRGMTEALAEGIREDIAPALEDLDANIEPMAGRLLASERVKDGIGALAHEVSREIVLGSEGALDTATGSGSASGS